MELRSSLVRSPRHSKLPGSSQLTFAQHLLTLEELVQAFARPLMLAGFFIVLAWLDVFKELYPWLHVVALVLFFTAFFDALGKSHARFVKPSLASAKRRLEKANGLTHRPLDVLSDRLAVTSDEKMFLWKEHVKRSHAQLHNLRLPTWGVRFSGRDPYALRYALLFLLLISFCFGWGSWGNRMLEAINPSLGSSLHLFRPTLDAWISPPDYTGLAPIMIATPAGLLNEDGVLEVPEGSTITAHLAEKNGDAPELYVNGQSVSFVPDDHQDFGITAPIQSGDTISIRRGWRELGSWRLHVVSNGAPTITFTEAPSVSEQKSVKLSWQASDTYGISKVFAKITPREFVPGASDQPLEIELAAPEAKDAKRASFEDLTASPWAGLSVRIQLLATNVGGHTGVSEPVDFVLPERSFFNPRARVLTVERKKLLQNPSDEFVHDEAANIMAGMALEHTAGQHSDPLVLLALRAGAVRLVLDRTSTSAPPVANLLWQTAIRLEDGGTGIAERNLRQAQKDLADALDRNADQAEIQQRIDRLHQALAQYLAQLSSRRDIRTPMSSELEQALGAGANNISSHDLERMIEQLHDLAASGSRDGAREELAKIQQLLENLRTDHPQLTADQQKMIKRIASLRQLSRKQRQLLEDTFQLGQNKDNTKKTHALALQQEDLSRVLRTLLDSTTNDDATDDLDKSEQDMKGASADLRRVAPFGALQHQNKALATLQTAIDKMADNLKSSMFMVQRPASGSAQNEMYDPFGRTGYSNFMRNDFGMAVPDHLQARKVREILDELQRRAGDSDRSKTERDYIERLLQNF